MIWALCAISTLSSNAWLARRWTIECAPSLFAPGPSASSIDVLTGATWRECNVATGALSDCPKPPGVELPATGLVGVGRDRYPTIYRSPTLSIALLPGNRLAFVRSDGPPRIIPMPANLLAANRLMGDLSVSIVGHPDSGPYGIMAGHSPRGWTDATVYVTFFDAQGNPAPGQVLDQSGRLRRRAHHVDSPAREDDAYYAADLERSFWVEGGWMYDVRFAPRHWEGADGSLETVLGWPPEERMVFADGDNIYTVKGGRLTCWRFHSPKDGIK